MSWSLLWVDHWSGCKETLSAQPVVRQAAPSGTAERTRESEALSQASLLAAHAALERLAEGQSQAATADRS
ncbi:hypothetical protein H1W37_05735 [Stappia taiwanensis]|uniref:Uncharacterized protein n=1 Tax=Stappia taiwanensis TaxID=992267 RepID=A0A838XWC9_9HYPH|nr:hypothetical protein [Stappia taiwanensis]MBA4611140.1 hypothetical protein [Stappia taiwanensis]GGE86244.1 hypothetical protein GCM10007285_12330 [Stappia taiwanensis]